jgi:hypothetical protein
MNISVFPKHIFWSWKGNSDLPEELVAEQVILYGDLDDLFLLSKIVPQKIIKNANDKIISSGKYLKRTNLITKVILDG